MKHLTYILAVMLTLTLTAASCEKLATDTAVTDGAYTEALSALKTTASETAETSDTSKVFVKADLCLDYICAFEDNEGEKDCAIIHSKKYLVEKHCFDYHKGRDFDVCKFRIGWEVNYFTEYSGPGYLHTEYYDAAGLTDEPVYTSTETLDIKAATGQWPSYFFVDTFVNSAANRLSSGVNGIKQWFEIDGKAYYINFGPQASLSEEEPGIFYL